MEKNYDLVDLLKPMIDRGELSVRPDGTIRRFILAAKEGSPWLHAGQGHPMDSTMGDCWLWNNVMWRHVYRMRGVHSNCLSCYKVVLKPRNLEETVKVYHWQQSEPFACKVGADLRGVTFTSKTHAEPKHWPTHGLWGAYWYCRGVEFGGWMYWHVRRWADKNLSEDVKVFLKRGCTEFERTVGPSDKWGTPEEMSDYQRYMEEQVAKYVKWAPPKPRPQPELLHQQTLNLWVELAYGVGDETYKLFTGGENLMPSYVHYEDQADPNLKYEDVVAPQTSNQNNERSDSE